MGNKSSHTDRYPDTPVLREAGNNYYTFHSNCGKKVDVKPDGRVARRRGARDDPSHGVVVTKQPLKDNLPFEIRLDKKVSAWKGYGLWIGLTTIDPSKLEIPRTMSKLTGGVTIFWSGTSIYVNGKKAVVMDVDLDDCTIGDTIGLKKKSAGAVQFSFNGKDRGKVVKVPSNPGTMYAVVDIFGEAENVIICDDKGGVPTNYYSVPPDAVSGGSSNPDMVKLRMRDTVERLKSETVGDIPAILETVSTYIKTPLDETTDERHRQLLGDHLASIGGAHELTKLIENLQVLDDAQTRQWSLQGITLVQEICLGYSESSLKLCAEFGKSGLLDLMLCNVEKYGCAEEIQTIGEKYLDHSPWYHGSISRQEAEERLQRNGDFLVRDKSDQPDDYVLTVKWNGRPWNFVIVKNDDKYQLEGEAFYWVYDLVEDQLQSGRPVTLESSVIIRNPVVSNQVRNCIEESRRFLAMSALRVLYNCAKTTANKQMYGDIQASERITPFLKSENVSLVMGSLFVLSEITYGYADMSSVDDNLISHIFELLRKATAETVSQNSPRQCDYSTLEILAGLYNLAINDKNKARIVDIGGVPLLVELLKNDLPDIQEAAANALWTLAELVENKEKISSSPGTITTLKSVCEGNNAIVSQAAERVLIRLESHDKETRGPATATGRRCAYFELCKRFKTSMELSDEDVCADAFFNSEFNMCYCLQCHEHRGDKLCYLRGAPPKVYALPLGWCRFALE
ncbi:uncharacterized protein [Ptychodera flava]|uniref:uncharacterized protein n=1 Tax=Ptychodera flava TaxID=63121 RepID=UPI003969FAAF